MNAFQLQQIHVNGAEIVRELGLCINACEDAVTNTRRDWPNQEAEDLAQARDAAVMVLHHINRLRTLVGELQSKADAKVRFKLTTSPTGITTVKWTKRPVKKARSA